MCRKGVLMLKNNDVELLGGEADTMKENTQEVLLCKALQMPVSYFACGLFYVERLYCLRERFV